MTEQVVGSQRVYEGSVLRLRIDTVRLENGKTATREVVEHRGAVTIVPLMQDGRIVFVRQYRLPAEDALLELPAGSMDEGEQPEGAAQRELQEETGQRAGTLRLLCRFWMAPGYSTEFMHLFLAEGLSYDRLEPDEDEDVTVELHTLDDALAMVADGRINDSKTIIGLLLLARERAG